VTPDVKRLKAALADRYRIEHELGQGGMATVYLAEDLKHKRRVALKVLKPELAAVLGADRFVQEITTTASLQHPHILPLFDSGTADGFLFYVMPFIDGETLRTRLDRETQLGVEEAVKIATDVADALDYAHRHGVIHRDIKPENILLHEGRPMVADFGIALAVSAAAGGRMTETGLSLGTPHYMSPEQATAEKEVTARSDVYSLGSVLYEMLTGSPPHTGASAQQIIMKIVTEQAAPVTSLRKAVPPNVAAAVAQSLEKLPADRFASAKEFATALADPHFSGVAAHTATPAGPQRRWNGWTIALAATTAVMTAVATWAVLDRPAPAPRKVLRTTIELPDSLQLASISPGPRLAISPDGDRIVYAAYGTNTRIGRQLWLRSRDRLDAVPIAGAEDAYAPFFSPDGQRLGFFTLNPDALKTVSFDGALPQTVADSGLNPAGLGARGIGVWGLDGVIYVGSRAGVERMPETGGPRVLVSHIDSTAAERGHWPTDVLPNGRGLIVIVAHLPTTLQSLYDIAVLDLRDGRHRVLTRGVMARYLPPGYLVYSRADGALMAAPFDQDRLELTGPAVALGGGADAAAGFADFALTRDGSLLHSDRFGAGESSELVWVARDGTITEYDPAWRDNFESVALSPDGRRLAVGLTTRTGAEVWTAQVPAGPRAKLTVNGLINYRPSWTADGRRVVFRSMNDSTGRFELLAKRADGIGSAEPLARLSRSIATGFLSRDGQWRILRTDATEQGRGDVVGLRAGDSVPTPLIATAAEERYPALAPNGRWLAYRSDAGGTHEIWVSPFPNVQDGRWQVSVAGGTEPVWSHSGRELFYLTQDNELVAATVTPEPPFAVLDRRTLFARPVTFALNIAISAYDVSPDDSRFLMIRSADVRPQAGVGPGRLERLILVDNWIEELQARMAR
jgi:eukaryotic-like serine/threonine-protein kinase